MLKGVVCGLLSLVNRTWHADSEYQAWSMLPAQQITGSVSALKVDADALCEQCLGITVIVLHKLMKQLTVLSFRMHDEGCCII